MLTAAAVWLASYLIGAIPFGYLVARARGVDLFKSGSGNIGATNVGRLLGKKFAILVFVLDCAKGAAPVAIARALRPGIDRSLPDGWLEVGAGLAAFLGHLFPIYLGFRGGKGVATGAGVALVLLPGPALAAALAWLVVAAATCYVSFASLAAVASLGGAYFILAGRLDLGDPRALFCLAAGALVVVKHRANIKRLLQGTENKISWGVSMRKTLHVMALGLWFGSAVFFTFVVTPSLFGTFEALGESQTRPAWFPLPERFSRQDAALDGPKEQGLRAAGYAVGWVFPWYFALQGFCGIVAAWTAMTWRWENRGASIHKWRTRLLVLALLSVLIAWPLEHRVSELRVPRNDAVDAYLASGGSDAATAQRLAREEFGRWHFYSLALNFLTILLVTGGMALAGHLPASEARREEKQQIETANAPS